MAGSIDPRLADPQRTVELGNGDVRLILHSPEPPTGSAEWVKATLVGPGLDATHLIDLELADGLPAFFAELALDWRGWDGPRAWESMEEDMKLVCHHDRVGHVAIEVSIGLLPPPGWQTPGWTAEAVIIVDPGALEMLSTALNHLLVEA